MANPAQLAEPYASIYALCRLQASTDGAFDESLMLMWFRAAWDQCAAMTGLVWPPQQIREPICINPVDGSFRLSHRPSSEVRIYDGYRLVAILPPSLLRNRCTPSLCCLCHPTAHYTIGSLTCELPSGFVMAVVRLFAFLVENRGDTQLDEHTLAKCGALTFLQSDVLYVV